MDRHDQKQETIASVEATKHPFDTFGVAIFLVVLVEIILLVGLNLYQKSRAQNLGRQLNEAKQTLATPEYAKLNNQLEEVLAGQQKLQTVLAGKAQWSKFYSLLNGVTPKNVKINSIQVSNSGTFRIEAETPTLSTLAHALVAWQNGTAAATTPFSSVKLNANGYASDRGSRIVTFSVSGTINLSRMK